MIFPAAYYTTAAKTPVLYLVLWAIQHGAINTYIRRQTKPSLIQIIIGRLFGAKPLCRQMLLNSLLGHKTKPNEISIETWTFSSKKMHWNMSSPKWRLFNLSLHVFTHMWHVGACREALSLIHIVWNVTICFKWCAQWYEISVTVKLDKLYCW